MIVGLPFGIGPLIYSLALQKNLKIDYTVHHLGNHYNQILGFQVRIPIYYLKMENRNRPPKIRTRERIDIDSRFGHIEF